MPIGHAGDVFGLPGPVSEATLTVLDRAVAIVHRIVPWSDVVAAPALVIEEFPSGSPAREVFYRKDSGTNYVKVGGFSFDDEGLIALYRYNGATNLISAACHEARHQLERILDITILDEIDSHLVPLSWGSAYPD